MKNNVYFVLAVVAWPAASAPAVANPCLAGGKHSCPTLCARCNPAHENCGEQPNQSGLVRSERDFSTRALRQDDSSPWRAGVRQLHSAAFNGEFLLIFEVPASRRRIDRFLSAISFRPIRLLVCRWLT